MLRAASRDPPYQAMGRSNHTAGAAMRPPENRSYRSPPVPPAGPLTGPPSRGPPDPPPRGGRLSPSHGWALQYGLGLGGCNVTRTRMAISEHIRARHQRRSTEARSSIWRGPSPPYPAQPGPVPRAHPLTSSGKLLRRVESRRRRRRAGPCVTGQPAATAHPNQWAGEIRVGLLCRREHGVRAAEPEPQPHVPHVPARTPRGCQRRGAAHPPRDPRRMPLLGGGGGRRKRRRCRRHAAAAAGRVRTGRAAPPARAASAAAGLRAAQGGAHARRRTSGAATRWTGLDSRTCGPRPWRRRGGGGGGLASASSRMALGASVWLADGETGGCSSDSSDSPAVTD